MTPEAMPEPTPSTHALTIDVHCHVLPRDLPDMAARTGTGGWVTLHHGGALDPDIPFGCAHMRRDGKLFRVVGSNLFDDDVRLAEMDAAGVDAQVLSTVPVLFAYGAAAHHALELARVLNDDIAARCRRHPRRFIGLGTVPLQDAALAIAELRRCRDLGLRGVEIGSHVGARELDDPSFEPVWRAAVELDLAVFVHPWDMMGVSEGRLSRHWLPWLVSMPAETTTAICSILMGGVLERHPGLRLLFAHGGGAFLATLGRIDHGFAVRPDLCQTRTQTPPSAFLGRFWLDSLVHDPAALRNLLAAVGAARVCLGSDYPFPLGEHPAGAILRHAGLDAASEQQVRSGAACACFGLDPSALGDPARLGRPGAAAPGQSR